jgi:uncharacterized protein YndB with AHSA1/START domain
MGKPVSNKSSQVKKTTQPKSDMAKPAKKEKYKKFEMEYPINSSRHILFTKISTATGLKEWFADDVKESGNLLTFIWDSSYQTAKIVSIREDHHVKFRWTEYPESTFFEFKIEVDELTGDIALIIIDFAEDDDSIASSKQLWNSQIENLFHILGAHS